MRLQPLDCLSDDQLVLRLAEGHVDSLGILFDRHMQSIDRLLWFLGVSPAELDELTQRTFLRAHLAARHFDGRMPVKNWLFGIAIEAARSHRRSALGWMSRAWDGLMGLPKPEPAATAAEFTRRQLAAELAHALRSLSAGQREVFALLTVEGLSGSEAAALLQLPIGMVWERLHEARSSLSDVVLAAQAAIGVSHGQTPSSTERTTRSISSLQGGRLDRAVASGKMKAMTNRPIDDRRGARRAAIFAALALLLFSISAYFLSAVGFVYSLGDRVGFVQKISDRGWACRTYEGVLVVGNVPAQSDRQWAFSVRDRDMAEYISALEGRRVALHYEQRKGFLSSCVGETEYLVTGVRTLD